MNVLTINTYAGSLLLGARAAGARLVASLEDKAYGVEVQRANFPDLLIEPTSPEWSPRDLRGAVVLAHPPCAPFCLQNDNIGKPRGSRHPAFKCTVDALTYALGARADAVALESVPLALEGAREVHEQLAARYGYRVYRVTPNACAFGLPQWRPRFWAIFTRRRELRVALTPRFNPVRTILKNDGPVHPLVQRYHDRQVERAVEFGYTRATLRRVMSHPGILARLLSVYAPPDPRRLPPDKDPVKAVSIAVTGEPYISHSVRTLDPEGLAPTLMSGYIWFCGGRLLTENEYKAVMGFPRDYAFPGRHHKELQAYLSRGVCPPVAEWITRLLAASLAGRWPPGELRWTLRPGETLDLRVRRKVLERERRFEWANVETQRRLL